MSITEWYPARLLEGNSLRPYAVLVLNQSINTNALNAVIKAADLLVCADGGGNRLLDYDHQEGVFTRKPDAIIGDMDSISQETLGHYNSVGVTMIKDPDQYSTDFTKSLKWLRQTWNERNGEDAYLDVVVMGGLGGRVDQGFSQIHHMYMVTQHRALLHGSIYLLSEQSLSFVLEAGHNKLHVNQYAFSENVGIIPILGLTKISISGFEWDVSDWETEFGGQVSTSNHIRSDTLEVVVDGPRPLFTLELASRLAGT